MDALNVLIPVFGTVALFIIFVIYPLTLQIRYDFLKRFKSWKTRREEFGEAKRGNSAGESAPVRELTIEERKMLSTWSKGLIPKRVIFFGFIVLMLLSVGFGLWFKAIDGSGEQPYRLYGLLFVVGVSSLFWYEELKNKYYFDSRSGVFKVEGKLIKSMGQSRGSDYEKIFTIRGTKFYSRENPQLDVYWKEWNDGDVASVEYSPFSMHIWNIKKAG